MTRSGHRRRAVAGRALCSFVLAVLSVCWSPQSAAARRVRPRFEPTDLELDEPGTVVADLELGFVHGEEASRLMLPDFELDVGLTDYLELTVDGAYAIEGPSRSLFHFDHPSPDSLWLAAKLGLYDARAANARQAWAVGVQLGPKLPTAAGSHGVGVEALGLLAFTHAPLQLMWNVGGFVDPAAERGVRTRPSGLELGLEATVDLADQGDVQLVAGTGFVRFVAEGHDQLTATLGANWQLIEALSLSVTGLVGLLSGGDRFALLLGVAPKLSL